MSQLMTHRQIASSHEVDLDQVQREKQQQRVGFHYGVMRAVDFIKRKHPEAARDLAEFEEQARLYREGQISKDLMYE